jgi:hypothetical protein
MADKDFMEPFGKLPGKLDKLKQAGQKVAKSTSKGTNQKIQARELLKKVIRGLPWEAKKAALDIIRAEIEAGPGIGSAGTMDVGKLPVNYSAKPDSDVAPWTRKDARRAAGDLEVD